MNISYSRPLDLGWRRMKHMLFHPFDLGRWMVLGFTAWLAQLADGTAAGSGGQDMFKFRKDLNSDSIRDSADSAWGWLADFAGSAGGILLMALILVGVLVVSVLLLWISSRGRFMFLDNLVHDRTEVTTPWQEFRVEGDSLFLWQFVYGIVAFVVLGAVIGGFVILLVPTAVLDLPAGIGLLAAVGLGMTLFLVVTVLAFIEYFLHHFIVPIMHKQRVSATAAWGLFLPLLRTHAGAFVLFGLFYLAITTAMGIAYVIGGVLTCCLGLLLMALPYLGTVLTLPISVLGRFINLEFLAQFGDDFNLLSPLPDPVIPGSGQFQGDGAVVRTEDPGQNPGRDETGTQDL